MTVWNLKGQTSLETWTEKGTTPAESQGTLNATIAYLGSTETPVIVSTSMTLTANLTIPSNIQLIITKGGSIISGGFTLTINGPFEAGLYQVFSGFGAGDVTGLENPNCMWFGAKGDGITDDTAAFQLTQASAKSAYGTCIIPAGTFVLDNFTPGQGIRNICWCGAGRDVTILKQKITTTPTVNMTSPSAGYHGGGIEDMTIQGIAGGTFAFKMYATGANVISDCVIRRIKLDCNGSGGFYMEDGIANNIYANIIEDLTIWGHGGSDYGITLDGINGSYEKIQVLYSGNYKGVLDNGSNNVIEDIASDAVQNYAGVGETVINPAVETIYTPSSTTDASILTISGSYNVLINPAINNVAVTAHHYEGFKLFNDGNTLISPAIYGTVYPSYPLVLGSNYGTVMGFTVPAGYTGFKLEAYTTADALAAHTLIGIEQISTWIKSRVKTMVIPTANLPAASAAMGGTMLIEDNGAGDRNIIIYAGGQRFRLDGGAAF